MVVILVVILMKKCCRKASSQSSISVNGEAYSVSGVIGVLEDQSNTVFRNRGMRMRPLAARTIRLNAKWSKELFLRGK